MSMSGAAPVRRTSAPGALPPDLSEREWQQGVGYDAFADTSGNVRFLRDAVIGGLWRDVRYLP